MAEDKKEEKYTTFRIDTEKEKDIGFVLDAPSRQVITNNDEDKTYVMATNDVEKTLSEEDFINEIMGRVAYREIQRMKKMGKLGEMKLG